MKRFFEMILNFVIAHGNPSHMVRSVGMETVRDTLHAEVRVH